MERSGGGSIVISDYDPAWPAIFEQERASLQIALGPPCAECGAHWEYRGAGPGCQADHRYSVKRPQP